MFILVQFIPELKFMVLLNGHINMAEQRADSESIKIEPIILRNSRVSAEVTPQGAFVNTLSIDGNEIIFPRRKDNPKRGGIPVLGPTPGPVKGTGWENLYPKMPQHGLDRVELWETKEQTETKIVSERILGPKEFLFSGRETIEIELLDNGLEISKSVTNFEEKQREIGSAFHPYFVADKETKVEPAEIADIYPPELGKPIKIKPALTSVTINNKNGSYQILAEPEPVTTLVWTDKPEDYICIEPWWADTGKGDIIGPGETKKYSLTITKK